MRKLFLLVFLLTLFFYSKAEDTLGFVSKNITVSIGKETNNTGYIEIGAFVSHSYDVSIENKGKYIKISNSPMTIVKSGKFKVFYTIDKDQFIIDNKES